MDLNNFILILLLIGFSLFFYKYFLAILNKYNSKFLIDNQFKKPQAFHDYPVPVAGGLHLFFAMLIIFSNFLFIKNIILFSIFLTWFYR